MAFGVLTLARINLGLVSVDNYRRDVIGKRLEPNYGGIRLLVWAHNPNDDAVPSYKYTERICSVQISVAGRTMLISEAEAFAGKLFRTRLTNDWPRLKNWVRPIGKIEDRAQVADLVYDGGGWKMWELTAALVAVQSMKPCRSIVPLYSG
jgi:hypothetical protein